MNKKLKKSLTLSFVLLVLAVMYIPILLLIVFSFTYTRNGSMSEWGGFSFQLYGKMLGNAKLMTALGNTMLIALISALLATVIGTISAIGIHHLRRRFKLVANTVNQVIIVNADIVTAVAFMLFFFCISIRSYGYLTLIIAHTMITVPFVILTISPRLSQLNSNLYDAGLDLGAGPMRTLFTVVIPQLLSAMIAGFAIAFTLSVDDFVVTKFNNGAAPKIDTISTYLYSSLKQANVLQELRALSTVIFVVSFGVLLFMNFRKKRKNKMLSKMQAASPATLS